MIFECEEIYQENFLMEELEDIYVPSWESAKTAWERAVLEKAEELGCSYDEALEEINQRLQKEWEDHYRAEIDRLMKSGLSREEAEDAYIPF